jgi:hypothetical protein
VRIQFPHKDDAFGVVVSADTIRVDLDGRNAPTIGRFHNCMIDWVDRRDWYKQDCGESAGLHPPSHPPQHRPWDGPSRDRSEMRDRGDDRWEAEDDDDGDNEYRGRWGRRHHRMRVSRILVSIAVLVLVIVVARKCCRRQQREQLELSAPMMQLPQALPPQMMPAPGQHAYYPPFAAQPPSALHVSV